jgi:hypothetical protein
VAREGSPAEPNPNETGNLIVDAGLHLLDRQIIDKDGLMAGKVDDLEVTFPEGGSSPPFVSAILAGPVALARQLDGRLGRWIGSLHRRLHGSASPAPARVSFGLVKKVGTSVELTVSRDELDVNRGEAWVRDTIIAKIPGAGHEPQ